MDKSSAMSARSLHFYVIARHWVSDLDFFKIETAFLHRLLDNHFGRLCEPDTIEKLRAVGKKLAKLEAEEQEIDKVLARQLKNIELMAEDVMPEDAEALAATQVQLEHLLTKLTRRYREVKKELFTLLETVIHEQRFLMD